MDLESRVGKLEGDVRLLARRADDAEDWIAESKGFHVEMRRFRDRLEATLEAEAKTQAERHQENSERLAKMANNLSIKTKWWTAAGVAVSFAALLVAILSVIVMVKLANHSLNIFPPSTTHIPYLARN